MSTDRPIIAGLSVDILSRVFVHRYRDADSGIRADCVREMGIWMKRHPAHFLEGTYLRYVGWVLSDTVSRIVKSLDCGYSRTEPPSILLSDLKP